MIEAVYATRGQARAVILAERVVVPLSGASGDNRRRGDVTLGIDDVPLPMVVQEPLVAHCAEATPCRPLDAWDVIDVVPAALVARLLAEFRRLEEERLAVRRWRIG